MSRVTGIFTGTTISPGELLRQCPDHYAFRAGRNLPDKEFRYLRTVIVTAAVYWGFNSELAPLLLTFQHRAGVSPYTSSYDLAETCVFDKQLPGPIHCGSPFREHPFSPKLRGQFAEFLNNSSPVGLRVLLLPTCVGLRYGRLRYSLNFSRLIPSMLRAIALPFARATIARVTPFLSVLQFKSFWRLRNFYRMCIGYAFRPHLSSRLTRSGRTFLLKPEAFGHYDSHIILATHSGILSSLQSTRTSVHASPRKERSPTTRGKATHPKLRYTI